MVICGIRLWVQSRCRAMSPCLSGRCHSNYWVGRGGTQRDMKGGGGVVVIICAYEEGWSSLGASSWQLLWSTCLWGEVAQRHGCTPQRLAAKWLPKGYNNIHYLHIRNTNYFWERTSGEVISRSVNWHKNDSVVVLIIVWGICHQKCQTFAGLDLPFYIIIYTSQIQIIYRKVPLKLIGPSSEK